MDLWIRSQDKEKLISSRLFRLDQNNHCKIVSFAMGKRIDIGIYNTKARALEVLDEIVEFLYHGCKETIIRSDNVEIEMPIYQMPSE